MKISHQLLMRIERDLALDHVFKKGTDVPVSNCWHLYVDGNAAGSMFYDKQDFIDGMNRIYLVSTKFSGVVILAFALMDTHVHIVAYGNCDDCRRFFNEYLRRTSMSISSRHGIKKKLSGIQAGYQKLDTDTYLKKAICYVIKNPTSAGLKYLPYDYPWSSGAMYFRSKSLWTSPSWSDSNRSSWMIRNMSIQQKRACLKSRNVSLLPDVYMFGDLVFPGEYVAADLVERIFRSCRSFTYFLGNSKKEDMDFLEKDSFRLSMPIQELRQHRNELCMELFGSSGTRELSMPDRLKLARSLRMKYSCSTKQICLVCGLVYEEAKDTI